MKQEIEKLRRRISRIGFSSMVCSFNEATNIDLNWLQFDAECDIRFLKYYHKLRRRIAANPGGLDSFLMGIVERRGLNYLKDVRKIKENTKMKVR